MSYILELSLEKIALVKIGSILWNQTDIKALIENFSCMNFLCDVSTEKREWKRIEDKVIEKVRKLRQPKRFKEKISGFVRPMGWQILKWIEYHSISKCAQRCYLTVHIPRGFSWTPHGTINRRGTARILIRDPRVDIATRYKLAYIYCLEDDVEKSWNTVPRDCLESVYTTEEEPGVITEQEFVIFWTGLDALQENIRWHTGASPLENAFRNAVESDSKPAAEYFLKKLTPMEREAQLVAAAQDIPDVEVLCFLLSEMNEDQRMRVFKSNPQSVMLKVFDWPWMNFFMESANRMWDSLSRYDNCFCFSPLTALIISKVNNGYEDSIYQKLFKEIWQSGCKRFSANMCANPCLLSSLFYVKDKENIELVFQDISPSIKKEFLLSSNGFNISQHLMREKESELLDFFLRECFSSKQEIKKYKKKLKETVTPKYLRESFDINTLIHKFSLMMNE